MERTRRQKRLKQMVMYILLALLAFIWLVPLFFCFFTALKSNQAFFKQPVFAWPEVIEWPNFSNAVSVMFPYMKNGAIICLLKVPLGILIEALAAFALTRLKLKFSNVMFVFFLLGMMLPHQVALVPLNIMLAKMNLRNTYGGLFFVYVGFGISFGLMVLRGFMRGIPMEIDESAHIDGANNWQLFWRIIFPLAKPAVATLVIMDSLSTWNEFMVASVLITDDKMRTVPAGLIRFEGEAGIHYPRMCAGVLVALLPIFLIYLLFQKYFVEGMSGAVKG